MVMAIGMILRVMLRLCTRDLFGDWIGENSEIQYVEASPGAFVVTRMADKDGLPAAGEGRPDHQRCPVHAQHILTCMRARTG